MAYNITTPAATKTSINLQVRVNVGKNQILTPVSAYNVSYTALDASQVEQKVIRLAPDTTYASPAVGEQIEFLVINTNVPIELTFLDNNNSLTTVTVNNLFVLDSPIKNYNLILAIH